MDFSQGFLSEPFDDVRKEVRMRYARHRDLLLRANRECVKAQHAIDIDPTSQRQVLAAVLFARTLACVQSSILLLEHGLVSQSRTMLRASLETLFQMHALWRQPAYAEIIIEAHRADQRTVAERASRWKSEGLRDALRRGISEAELEVLQTAKAPPVNLYQAAVKGDMEDWYLSLYSLLSFPAHGKVSDLTSHLVHDENGFIEELQNEPEIDAQESTWAYAIEIELKAAEGLAGIFSSAQVDLSNFKRELVQLLESG